MFIEILSDQCSVDQKKISGTMDIRPEFSKCDHGDCYSFVFGLPFYDQNAQGKTSHDK